MSIVEFGRRLKQALTPAGSVSERAVTSGVWSGTRNVVNRLIQLTKITILARLLSPADFGLIGIGFIVISVLRHFSNLGVDAALIQQEDENVDSYLNTVWTLKIARGALIALPAILLAPYIAMFFSEPRATPVIRVLALSPVIMGFRNPGLVYLQKDLEFQKRFIQYTSGTVSNFVVAVVLGILLQNVWALVFGTLAGNLTALVFSYVVHDYRPWIGFDLGAARELMDYGKWIMGGSVIHFLINQGDNAFVGWLLGATPLGFYQMAARFGGAPASEITQVISTVAFPSFSQIQDDATKLRKGFYQTARMSTFVALPAGAGVVAVAPLFVRTFLGSQWIPVIPVLRLLAIWGSVRALGAAMGPLFKTVGRPDIGTKMATLNLITIVIFIYPAGTRFGLPGVAGAMVLSTLISFPIISYIAIRIVNGSVLEFVRIILFPAVGSVGMAAGVIAAQRALSSGILVVDFLAATLWGILLYVIYTVISTQLLGYRIDNELSQIYESFY